MRDTCLDVVYEFMWTLPLICRRDRKGEKNKEGKIIMEEGVVTVGYV